MRLQRDKSPRNNESGFTLIETAIVVVIGGILVAAFATGILELIKNSKVKTTNERIAKVNSAIREYLEANEHLPCAANRTIDTSDPNYGVGLPLAQCMTAGPVSGTAWNANVRIGMVPTRELGLPDEYGYDGWGSRFLYAVSDTLVDAATYDSRDGKINIISRTGASAIDPPNSGNFIILSHGPDRKGGFINRNSASPVIPCTAGQMDTQNCNDNRTFRVSQNYLRAGAADYYDDITSYMGVELPLEELPDGAVLAFDGSCPDDWRELRETNGRFIIGAGRYTHKALPVPEPLGDYPNSQKGSATWLTDTLSGGTNEYINLPPYIVLRYCIRDVGNDDFNSPITYP